MTPPITKPNRKVVYPESDGQPMSDNTLQFKWIVTIQGGVDGMFKDDHNVFVAGDLLWYPIEGDNKTCSAPDTLAAFGRPKGERGSYRQWEEGGIAPQVVFEVLSPGNRSEEMVKKFLFYQRFGVEEYYIYDPDRVKLEGYRRDGDSLVDIPEMDGWISPRLGIRFDMSGDELVIYRPDGRRFLTYRELLAEEEAKTKLGEEERLARLQAQQRADLAQQRANEEKQRANEEKQRADEERLRGDQEKQRADEEKRRADEEKQRADQLAEQLRRLGIDVKHI